MAVPLSSSLIRFVTRPLAAGVVLVLVYVGLSFAMSTEGYLGTDTGAKVATLEVMQRRATSDPDVGYWAEDLDPDGDLHPLYQTEKRDEGRWVAVTTLPMLQAGRPLYDLGGYRAALLLPMLGAVAAAFAARSLARRIDRADDGWMAFWVVGLASPVVIYALDFWEHSIGLACMVWAVVLLLDVLDGSGAARAAGAGALFGAGAILRTETFVYAAVAVGVVCALQVARSRKLRASILTGLAAVAGFAGPWLANVALEQTVGGTSRTDRATDTAREFGAELGDRVKEGLQTLVGLNAGSFGESVILGLVLVAIVGAGFRAERRGDARFATACVVGAACGYLFDALGGLGFISGLLVAFPIAIAGLVRANANPQSRVVAGIAVVSLPLVYLVQYLGGAAPQWGGRYTLTSGILLGVVGLVGLAAQYPTMAKGLVVLSLAVTGLGVTWVSVRSHGVEDFFEDVERASEPVLISRNAFLIREAGAVAVGERWLSVRDEEDFTAAVDVARETGERRFSVLAWGAAAPPDESIPDDVNEVSRDRLEFVNVPVGLVTYEFTG